MRTPDWSLYLVTDRALSRGRGLPEIVRMAVAGGVSAVQLREKTLSTLKLAEMARALLKILRPLGVPLIINDSPEAALHCKADGVHLGQSDMPVSEARRLLGTEALIGLSVENIAQAKEANTLPVDYLGISPVYGTPTKKDTATPLGLEGLRAIRGITKLPLVAIGGINASTAPEVVAAGADGLAVVSAICSADDPESAARELLDTIKETQNQKT